MGISTLRRIFLGIWFALVAVQLIAITASTSISDDIVQITEPQAIFLKQDGTLNLQTLNLSCNSRVPYRYCSWFRPDGSECRLQGNCAKDAIKISDNETLCEMSMDLLNSGVDYSGKWMCNIIFNLTTSETLTAETEVYRVEEKSLKPILVSETGNGNVLKAKSESSGDFLLEGEDVQILKFNFGPRLVETNILYGISDSDDVTIVSVIIESWPPVSSGSLSVSGRSEVTRFTCPANDTGVCELVPQNASLVREVSVLRLNQTYTTLSLKVGKESLVSETNEVTLNLDQAVEVPEAGSGPTELRIVVHNSDASAAGEEKSGIPGEGATTNSNIGTSIGIVVAIFVVIGLVGFLVFHRYRNNVNNYLQRGVYDVADSNDNDDDGDDNGASDKNDDDEGSPV